MYKYCKLSNQLNNYICFVQFFIYLSSLKKSMFFYSDTSGSSFSNIIRWVLYSYLILLNFSCNLIFIFIFSISISFILFNVNVNVNFI